MKSNLLKSSKEVPPKPALDNLNELLLVRLCSMKTKKTLNIYKNNILVFNKLL